jgi:hypothetical protein
VGTNAEGHATNYMGERLPAKKKEGSFIAVVFTREHKNNVVFCAHRILYGKSAIEGAV